MPEISTSISPETGSPRWVRLRRRTLAAGAASTTAGTKCGGAFSAPAIECRACRRQVNTCCGVSPCRRATSEITAPTTSVSSTTRALKSPENRRRRPVPVITSKRRTSVPSGSSLWSIIDTSRSPIHRSTQSPVTRPNERWEQDSAYDEAEAVVLDLVDPHRPHGHRAGVGRQTGCDEAGRMADGSGGAPEHGP
jgi:hypothetical protein